MFSNYLSTFKLQGVVWGHSRGAGTRVPPPGSKVWYGGDARDVYLFTKFLWTFKI